MPPPSPKKRPPQPPPPQPGNKASSASTQLPFEQLVSPNPPSASASAPGVPQLEIHYEYTGRVKTSVRMSLRGAAGGGGGGAAAAGAVPGAVPAIRDLVHPNLTDPLRQQQQITFRLVKTGRKEIEKEGEKGFESPPVPYDV